MKALVDYLLSDCGNGFTFDEEVDALVAIAVESPLVALVEFEDERIGFASFFDESAFRRWKAKHAGCRILFERRTGEIGVEMKEVNAG